MSRVATALIWGAIAFAASLTLARLHPFGDAGLYVAKGAEAPIMNDPQAPPEVRGILRLLYDETATKASPFAIATRREDPPLPTSPTH